MQLDRPDGAAVDATEPSSPPVRLRRLTKRWQFLACAKGRSLARGAVAIQILARDDGGPEVGVGFTATRKIGGAVVRNRAKRRMREAARLLIPLHGLPSHDYVLIARNGAAERPWPRLLDDVKSALLGLAAGGDAPPPSRPRPARSGSSASRSAKSASASSPSAPPS